MPRNYFDKSKRHPRNMDLGVLILGTMEMLGKDYAALGDIMGCSESTARNRMKSPGKLTVDELAALSRGLPIPIEKIREAIRV